jgi:hypothetical protein
VETAVEALVWDSVTAELVQAASEAWVAVVSEAWVVSAALESTRPAV